MSNDPGSLLKAVLNNKLNAGFGRPKVTWDTDPKEKFMYALAIGHFQGAEFRLFPDNLANPNGGFNIQFAKDEYSQVSESSFRQTVGSIAKALEQDTPQKNELRNISLEQLQALQASIQKSAAAPIQQKLAEQQTPEAPQSNELAKLAEAEGLTVTQTYQNALEKGLTSFEGKKTHLTWTDDTHAKYTVNGGSPKKNVSMTITATDLKALVVQFDDPGNLDPYAARDAINHFSKALGQPEIPFGDVNKGLAKDYARFRIATPADSVAKLYNEAVIDRREILQNALRQGLSGNGAESVVKGMAEKALDPEGKEFQKRVEEAVAKNNGTDFQELLKKERQLPPELPPDETFANLLKGEYQPKDRTKERALDKEERKNKEAFAELLKKPMGSRNYGPLKEPSKDEKKPASASTQKLKGIAL